MSVLSEKSWTIKPMANEHLIETLQIPISHSGICIWMNPLNRTPFMGLIYYKVKDHSISQCQILGLPAPCSWWGSFCCLPNSCWESLQVGTSHSWAPQWSRSSCCSGNWSLAFLHNCQTESQYVHTVTTLHVLSWSSKSISQRLTLQESAWKCPPVGELKKNAWETLVLKAQTLVS